MKRKASPYDDVFPGGAYRQSLIHGWMQGTIHPASVADELEAEVLTHESPSDPWWDDVTPNWDNVAAPAVFWAGWYDIFLDGTIAAFNGYNTYGAGSKGKSWLVIDPLGHCQGAASQFKKDTIAGRNSIGVLLALALFTGDLDKTPPVTPEKVKRVTFYVMGANYSKASGNHWTSLDAWPKAEATKYYMHPTGKLTRDALSAGSADNTTTYLYDPKKPVPTVGGNNLIIKCGPKDQRAVQARSDVLVYTSEAFKEPMAITGEMKATLFVSSKGVNDTDFTVKLTDVYPSGASHLLQDGIIRMRWRKRGLKPVPIKEGEVEEIEISLWASSYVFSVGHKIQLSVSSSNYPRFEANPNTGFPMSNTAQKGVTKIAHNSLHFSASSGYKPSLTLPVVPLAALPVHPIVEQYEALSPEEKKLGEYLFAQSELEREVQVRQSRKAIAH